MTQRIKSVCNYCSMPRRWKDISYRLWAHAKHVHHQSQKSNNSEKCTTVKLHYLICLTTLCQIKLVCMHLNHAHWILIPSILSKILFEHPPTHDCMHRKVLNQISKCNVDFFALFIIRSWQTRLCSFFYYPTPHTHLITIIQLSLTGSSNLAHLRVCYFLWPQRRPHLSLAGVWNQYYPAVKFGHTNDPNEACLIGLDEFRGNHMYWISPMHSGAKRLQRRPAIKIDWGVSKASSPMPCKTIEIKAYVYVLKHEIH